MNVPTAQPAPTDPTFRILPIKRVDATVQVHDVLDVQGVLAGSVGHPIRREYGPFGR